MTLVFDAYRAATSTHARTVALLCLLSLGCFLPGFFTLAPVDRDEARFVQSTRQMVETGDYIDIRFQDETRYKKPVGIYWLQAASVNLSGQGAHAPIWVYRIPSLLGAVAVVLLTYWTALALVSRESAVLAAALTAALLLLGVEARLAKTDAVLCASIIASIGVLARLHMREDERHPFSLAAIFWIAGAAGILVKGPIWLMVVGLTAAARSLAARSVSWLAPLRPVAGAAFLLAAVLPWLIAIMVISDGAFLRQSVGHDMLGKVASAQESHGAPPGTYLGAFLITAWPMIAPMLLALGWIWRNRSLSAVMFLICWIVPAWIVFELVPTKLPHYVLPLYPGIAILAALALEKGGLLTGRFWTRLLLASGGAVLVYAPLIAFALYAWFEGRVPAAGIVFWLLLLPAGVLAVREGWRENAARALIVTALAAPLFYLSIYEGALSRVTSVRLAERVADAIGQSVSCKHPTVMSAGYNEASLLFELGTGTAFGTPDEAAAFLGQPGCRVALVTDAKREAFLLGIGKIGVDVIERAKVEGLNLGNARPVSVHVYEIRS